MGGNCGGLKKLHFGVSRDEIVLMRQSKKELQPLLLPISEGEVDVFGEILFVHRSFATLASREIGSYLRY